MTQELAEGRHSGPAGRWAPRVLIVCLAPLEMEMGASQMALNLAAALREEGATVSLWSPYPLPVRLKWFRLLPHMRRALASFVTSHGPFDVIDAPAEAISGPVARAGVPIARSIQPEIRYRLAGPGRLRTITGRALLRRAAHYVSAVYVTVSVLGGWIRADRILCLGSLEHEWMSRWCPWWRHKLCRYVSALGCEDQAALAAVRRNRDGPAGPRRRFLWIGRAAGHKGLDRLMRYITAHLKARPEDTFTIAGCGDGAAALLPREIVASGRVRVIPAYRRDALPALLREHDVGLFTSAVEGWGLSLHEMLESGMPVYATHAGAVPDLAPYFKDALRRFPPGADERFDVGRPGAPPREYYEMFSWSAIARQYLGLVRAARHATAGARARVL